MGPDCKGISRHGLHNKLSVIFGRVGGVDGDDVTWLEGVLGEQDGDCMSLIWQQFDGCTINISASDNSLPVTTGLNRRGCGGQPRINRLGEPREIHFSRATQFGDGVISEVIFELEDIGTGAALDLVITGTAVNQCCGAAVINNLIISSTGKNGDWSRITTFDGNVIFFRAAVDNDVGTDSGANIDVGWSVVTLEVNSSAAFLYQVVVSGSTHDGQRGLNSSANLQVIVSRAQIRHNPGDTTEGLAATEGLQSQDFAWIIRVIANSRDHIAFIDFVFGLTSHVCSRTRVQVQYTSVEGRTCSVELIAAQIDWPRNLHIEQIKCRTECDAEQKEVDRNAGGDVYASCGPVEPKGDAGATKREAE